MSTAFKMRKDAQAQTNAEPTKWEFHADLDTMLLSISNASGLVKIDVGGGRRSPFLYRNEILAILDKGDEIRRYLDDHPQAKNQPPTKKQLAAMEALTATVVQAKEKQAYREGLKEAGLNNTQIDAAVIKKFGSV